MVVASTDEPRSQALDWAAGARERRHEVREQLRTGQTDLASVLDRRSSDEHLSVVKVLWVLESVPGARKIDTRRALTAMGVDASTTLGQLDDATTTTLVERFSAPTKDAPMSAQPQEGTTP